MTKKLATSFLLSALLAAAPAVRAQNGPENDANGAPGFTKSVFDSGQIDAINLYNGLLIIPIPVGPSYPIGPRLRMQLLLNYNSRVDGYGRPATQSDSFYYKPLVGNPALGIGWEMTMGAIKSCKHGFLTGVCFSAPDGSQHMFDLGSKTGDGSQLFLKGSGPYDMWDGEGNHYEFNWQVSGFDDSATNYTHDFGNGRNGWYLTSVTDPFGNSYSVTYYSSIATPLWTYSSNQCGTAWPMLVPPAGTQTWIMKDISAFGTVLAHVATAQVNGVDGMIKSVDFPGLVDGAPVTRTWTLAYDTTFSYTRSCANPNPLAIVANLQRLKQLQLPGDLSGSPSYQFLYSNQTFAKGLLERITLPTTGSISYCYGGYVFYHASSGSIQPGCPGMFPDPSDAAVTQTAACGLAAPDPEPAPAIPGQCDQDNSARWVQSEMGVVRRRETLGSVQNDTTYVQYAFPFGEAGNAANKRTAQTLTVVLSPPTDTATAGAPDAGRRRARAVLFDTSTEGTVQIGPEDSSVPGDRVGQDIEERVFETDPTTGAISDPPCTGAVGTDSAFCGSKAIRVKTKAYEYDTTGVAGGNRRVRQQKTIYGPSTCGTCPHHQVDSTLTAGDTWEGNGRHYNVETHSGTLGADARTITTDWAPVNWSSNPNDLSVLPNVLTQRTATQGSSVRSEYFDFDTTASAPTGFLRGTFVYDSIKDMAFIDCRYADPDGNVDKEFTKTLASASAPARTYCSDNHPAFPSSVGTDGDSFGKDYTWQKGELLNARWINGAVGTATFRFTDHTRDATTGWITSSRDTAGLTTSYTYDSLGRVNQIAPPAATELKTWVCYEGPNATTVYRAAARQTCPVSSSNAAITTWQHFDYDGLGRLSREKRLQPSAAVVKRFTLFDAPGHVIFASEWVPEATSEAIATTLGTACVFSGGSFARVRPSSAPGTYSMCWDPFGRPQQIVGSNHSSLTTIDRTDGSGNIYSDTKEAVKTYCVNATFLNQATATCNAGWINPHPVKTTQRDAFGRITEVIPPNTAIEKPARYAYDVNAKLTCVKQGGTAVMTNCTSNPGGQYRHFDYDSNGFLRSETTPERGTVGYTWIGSLGNVRAETQPGGVELSRTFDFAGRLTREDIPSGTKYVVNCYDGGSACTDGSAGFAGGSHPSGKLTRRYGYNFISMAGPVSGPVVDEQFTYSNSGGRLSQLATTVGTGDLNATTTQSWTYNTLGLVGMHNHPRIAGSFPVAYTYTNGLPTQVSGNGTNVATAITYNPAAGLASWTSGSSPTVTTTITPHTSLLPRPGQIKASRGATTLFDTGTYSFDSAGNILSESNATHGGSFTYDAGSRILSANYGSTRNFVYDTYGNLTQNGGYTFAMSSALSNRIRTATFGGSTTPVTYDSRGNVTGALGDTMSWDLEDRLFRNQNAASDWVFVHNGAGERIVKFPGSNSVLRREMARLITEANTKATPRKTGWAGDPATCTGIQFTNPPCSDPDANYIQSLYNHATAAGCGGTDFCPDSVLNRAQMAVFVVKGYQADGAPTPACTNIFADVPCTGSPYSGFAPYIEQLSRDNVTAGCGGSNFCPGNPVTSWQILVWLGKAPALPGGGTWATYRPVPRGSIYTLRDEQNRVVTEIAGGLSGASSATLAVQRDNVFLGSLLVASNSANAWTYSASDHLGSVRAIWNAAGVKSEDHRYWPYGEDSSALLTQHLGFQSMERNDGAAQYFDHARTQQYNLGRFLSPDMIGGTPANPGTWNRYAYALGNPMRFVDPDGNVAVGFTGLGNSPASGVHGIASVFARNPSIGQTRVFPHQDRTQAFAFVMSQLRADPNQPVVLFGHSRGAASSLSLARDLQKAGVTVNLLLTLDPVMIDPALNHRIPSNVALAVNYYEKLSSPLEGLYLTGNPDATEIENRRVLGRHGAVDDLVAGAAAELEGLVERVSEMMRRAEAAKKAQNTCEGHKRPCAH